MLQSTRSSATPPAIVLDNHGPCRVVDGDTDRRRRRRRGHPPRRRGGGGAPDDDATTDAATRQAVRPRTGRSARRSSRTSSTRKKRHTGVKLLGILVVWLGRLRRPAGPEHQGPRASRTLTDLHRKFNEARDWVQLEGAGQLVLRRGPRRHRRRRSTRSCEFFQELIASPGPAAAGAGDRLARRGRPRGLGHLRLRRPAVDDPGHRSRCCSFGVVGLWSDSMDTLIITLLSVVICMVIGLPLGIWMARSKAVSDVRHAGPGPDADHPAVLLPRAARAVLRHRPGRRGRPDASSTRCRRSSGSPSTASARSRRPPIEAARSMGLTGARCCVRCSCRWPGAPSSSASTSA